MILSIKIQVDSILIRITKIRSLPHKSTIIYSFIYILQQQTCQMVYISEILSDLSFDKSHDEQQPFPSKTPLSSLPLIITTEATAAPTTSTTALAKTTPTAVILPGVPINSPSSSISSTQTGEEQIHTITKMDEVEISHIHALSLAYSLYHLYQNKVGTDVTIQCNNELFEVHSFVLCHASPYFKQILHGIHPEKDVINLDERNYAPKIEAEALTCIIESLYTGMVDHSHHCQNLNKDNVTSILVAAYHLQFHHAYDTCINYMLRNINYDNCLTYWLSGKFCESNKVQEKALGIIGRHFYIIQSTKTFLGLRYQTVSDLLLGDSLQVPNEIVVYEATIAWVQHDVTNRKALLYRLLDVHRMSYLPAFYLLNVVGKEPLIQNCLDAFSVYSNAIKLKLGQDCDFPNANVDRYITLQQKKRHHFIHGIIGKIERMMNRFEPVGFDTDVDEHERLKKVESDCQAIIDASSSSIDKNVENEEETNTLEIVVAKEKHKPSDEEVMETNNPSNAFLEIVQSNKRQQTSNSEEQRIKTKSPPPSKLQIVVVKDIVVAKGHHRRSSSEERYANISSPSKKIKVCQKAPESSPNAIIRKSPKKFEFTNYDDDIASLATEVTKNRSLHNEKKNNLMSLKMTNNRNVRDKSLFKHKRRRDMGGEEEGQNRVNGGEYSPESKQKIDHDKLRSNLTMADKAKRRAPNNATNAGKKLQHRRRSLVDRHRQGKKNLPSEKQDTTTTHTGSITDNFCDMSVPPSYCCSYNTGRKDI